jgi:flagellar hook-basal body complex protein FliE
MNEINADSLIIQMRAMTARATGIEATPVSGAENFSAVLKSALSEVNAAQTKSRELATAFEHGAPHVELAEVMLAIQKANLAFQAVTQVRNRLVSAYQEVMNMPI